MYTNYLNFVSASDDNNSFGNYNIQNSTNINANEQSNVFLSSQTITINSKYFDFISTLIPKQTSLLTQENTLEVIEIKQKKCRTCGRFYKEDISNCYYHPGTFRNISTISRFSSWSCCEEPNKDGKGCKIGKHIECETTTINLNRFNQQIQNAEFDKKNNINLVDQAEGISKSISIRDINQNKTINKETDSSYISHQVKLTDTGICKYLKLIILISCWIIFEISYISRKNKEN